MTNKTALSLLEMLLMVMVLSLAAALCLRAFAFAGQLSKNDELASRAQQQAASAVEILKATRGDLGQAERLQGGQSRDGVWTLGFDRDWNAGAVGEDAAYVLEAAVERRDGLGLATVQVSDRQGRLLAELPGSWQEVAG